MPIYEEQGITREDLQDLRKKHKCKECGGMLNVFMDIDAGKAFLACNDWHRTHHEGIERAASRYETGGLSELNIPTRREIMEQEYGEVKTKALEKARLPMTGALTQPQAEHILSLVYPNVPKDEVIRCAILCRDFGLHPLMKEVYILGFKNTKTGKVDYSTVLGISASRKMAADRKGAYSFLDGTPRAATPEEIIKQYGKNSEEERDNLISICKLKGEKGNEATGFGLWPKDKIPYGTDKGNTKRNMANIRSERPTYSRLPGPALPPIEVIDEAYTDVPDIGRLDRETGEFIEGEYTEVKGRVVDEKTGEIIEPEPHSKPKEHWCQEHNCPFEKKTRGNSTWYAHKLPDGSWCNEKKKKNNAPEPEPIITPTPDAVAEQAFTPPDEPQQHKRDPDTINTINELYRACNEDFGLQPAQVLTELGYNSQSDIADSPADCYRAIAAVR